MERKTRVFCSILAILLCVSLTCLLVGCYGSSSTRSSKSSSTSQVTSTHTKTETYDYLPKNTAPPMPKYEDSRWPTRNPDLLAIPESNRWYNAWSSAGTNCTIAGPVVNVYQAQDSNGMPIFIDIGAPYPSNDSVSLVVWAYQYDDFAQMINEVDDGGAWISVTGYLSVYNGQLQFNAGDGYVEYTWWTHVS